MSLPTTNEAKKDQYVGQTKENVGHTFGNESLETKGQAQHNTGLIEETAANVGGLVDGTVNTVGGLVGGTVNTVGGALQGTINALATI
ncbi:hypothetical protein EDC94DRAFT_660477 [Helicostylum pulchrum]|nr:hypothetical protein EDC94DRAFT_660477 [Helicostylum pulchrum]